MVQRAVVHKVITKKVKRVVMVPYQQVSICLAVEMLAFRVILVFVVGIKFL